MTDAVRLLLALGLPWLLGALWLNLLVPTAVPSRRALILGHGYLVGLFAVTMLMRALDAAGLELRLTSLLTPLLLLIGLGAFFGVKRWPVLLRGPYFSADFDRLPHWQKLVAASLLALILVRLGGLWLEVFWRPLFPWDAFMHWATKAKVWTHTQSIVPFVDYAAWLGSRGEGVYTDFHPGYPQTIPLIQTWMNLVLGRWDESLMNLPWVPLLAAAALSLFAQARIAQVGPLPALVFVYLLMSMPMVNLQVALAGYADIYLGVFYLAAAMAFFQWARTGDGWQGLLALGFLLICPLLKNEGLYWSLSLLVGVVALKLPRGGLVGLAVLGALLLLAILAAFPRDLEVAGHSLADLDLRLRLEALSPLLRSLFVLDNWHLLFWLVTALLAARIVAGGSRAAWPRPLLGLAVSQATALFLVCFLFLMTEYATGAVEFTAASRITLHLVPALIFLAMMLWDDIANGREVRSESESNERS